MPSKYALGYGIWKMPERNGMEDFKNAMEDNNEQYVEVFRS